MTPLDQAYFDAIGEENKARVRIGLQCPECWGVRTDKRPEDTKFQCLECGCRWDRTYWGDQ